MGIEHQPFRWIYLRFGNHLRPLCLKNISGFQIIRRHIYDNSSHNQAITFQILDSVLTKNLACRPLMLLWPQRINQPSCTWLPDIAFLNILLELFNRSFFLCKFHFVLIQPLIQLIYPLSVLRYYLIMHFALQVRNNHFLSKPFVHLINVIIVTHCTYPHE